MSSRRRPFTVDDLELHHKIVSTTCSADGALAVCAVKTVDREQDKHVERLWAFDAQGPRQLTHGSGQDQSPQLSPDGRTLAFVSDRSGKSQVHLLSLRGGEARQLGNFPLGVSSIAWSPDGSFLLASAAVQVDPDLRGARPKGAPGKRKAKVELAWRLPYKTDGVGYIMSREIHLFRLDLASGDAEQLTDGAFDVHGFEVSPDGGRVAYVRTREGRYAHRTDLWTCGIDGSGHRQLTQDLATVMQPHWSPDGSRIAVTGAEREGDARSRFWLCPSNGGKALPLGDESVEPASGEAYRWHPDGTALLFARAHRGRHRPALLQVADGQAIDAQWPDRQLSAFAIAGEKLFYCVDHPSLPSELWSCSLDGAGERRLSRFNAWWDERTRIEAQVRSFSVPDGKGGQEQVEGWLIRPADVRDAGPLLNDVHGGPASYALMDFETNVYWQVLCSRGWSVLALNAAGSASYGPEFCDRLAGRWGELDLPQHLAAVRALQDDGVCDDRVAICGKSYGGYLSGYAIGNCDRFRAAVVMAPVGNIETHYGTSDGGYYADPLYMDAAPEFDRELARTLSPMRYMEAARTPTLFMQGTDDERCPKCQSEELFVSMYRAGKAHAELVLYPGENHAFLAGGKPSCRADAAERIAAWVTAHAGEAQDEPGAARAEERQESVAR